MIQGTAPLTASEADLVKRCGKAAADQVGAAGLGYDESRSGGIAGLGALGLPPGALLYLGAAAGILVLYLALRKKR